MHPQTSPSGDLRKQLQSLIDNKTKPTGSLGRLEEIALQVGLIQQSLSPQIRHPYIVVFAGDHGIAASGLVNPYPQAVTAQMVMNFVNGGAAINVFCRQHSIGLRVVDAGVNYDFDDSVQARRLAHEKIGYGTRNYLEENAMTREQAVKAIEAGKRIAEDLAREGCNCLGVGEMGIGNTSSASLIMSYVTGIPVEECVGRGTGMNDEQLETKKITLHNVYRRHQTAIANTPDPITILEHVGGFEIAMMMGTYLKATELKMVILVDGFIATAALLLARILDANVMNHCIFSHTSGEQGHERMLQYLGARPLLNLGLRLGEGTGAAIAFPLVKSATSFLREMASFESAGVSRE